jgi:hypothetical protein
MMDGSLLYSNPILSKNDNTGKIDAASRIGTRVKNSLRLASTISPERVKA